MTLLWTRVERARETDREKSELLSVRYAHASVLPADPGQDLMQRYQIVYDSWASLVHEKHQYQTQLRSWRVATVRHLLNASPPGRCCSLPSANASRNAIPS